MTKWADDMLAYTGKPDFHDVYTVSLFELIEDDVFSWDDIDWSGAAFDKETYERVCDYFIERFMFREISMQPYKIWAQYLKRKLIYELCPKYNRLYDLAAKGFDPLANEDEYYKRREIFSEYPQTMMSENSDYASTGKDEEYERIKYGNVSDSMENYLAKFKPIDEMMLDELECMFISSYSVNVNAL